MCTLPSLHAVPASWLRDSVLAPYISGYWQHLVGLGYAEHTARMYLYCVAHFAHWIRRRRIAACDLTDDVVRRFIAEHLPRCTCPSPVRRHARTIRAALRHLLIALDEVGVLRKDKVVSAIDDELRHFDEYMNCARGLARSTRRQRLNLLRSFLQQSHGADSRVPICPTQHELRRFIDRQLRRLCPASAKVVAGTLRAYLRYRATLGDAVAHLLPVITSPANRRLAALPQTLSQQEISQLLDAFPQGLPSRHRAYAMVRCLVDLGLRAGEVVTIDLDDIDWEAERFASISRVEQTCCRCRRPRARPSRHIFAWSDLRRQAGESLFAMSRRSMPRSVPRCYARLCATPIGAADYPIRRCTFCATRWPVGCWPAEALSRKSPMCCVTVSSTRR